MGNQTTIHKQKPFLSPIDKELFNNKHKFASSHYGKYLDKILEVTGGKVLHGDDEFNKKKH